MAAWGTRQSYPAVVGTTTLLVVVFTLAHVLRPLIPAPDPNPVTLVQGDYMQGAARQRVKWRTLNDDPFGEARRTDRPIVFVVGAAWSGAARDFDVVVLESPDVAQRLNREFVPVRVDTDMNPSWRPGPFALISAESAVDSGWYVLVTRPDGRPLRWLARSQPGLTDNEAGFLEMLREAQAASAQEAEPAATGLEAALATQQKTVSGASLGQGDLAWYADRVDTAASIAPGRVFCWPRPWEVRFLVSFGRRAQARSLLVQAIEAPFTDWLDGGFFRFAAYGPRRRVEFSKVAAQNADMAASLAVLGAVDRDPDLTSLAKRSARGVLDALWTSAGLAPFVWHEEGNYGRGVWYSFPPARLEGALGHEEARWATKAFQLSPGNFPQAVPDLSSWQLYTQDRQRFEAALEKLRQVRKQSDAHLGTIRTAETTGSVFARLAETARLTDDPQLKTAIRPISDEALKFKSGPDDVVRLLDPQGVQGPNLCDYLALADACLYRYLLYSDEPAAKAGLKVLTRARALFQPGGSGPRPLTLDDIRPEVAWTGSPCPTDGVFSSPLGNFIRLAYQYGCLFGNEPNGQALEEAARETVSRYAPLTLAVDKGLGCLAYAMSVVNRDRWVAVNGSGSRRKADRLAMAMPDTPCFPTSRTIRPDIARRGEGVWLVENGKVSGPFDEARALERLASAVPAAGP